MVFKIQYFNGAMLITEQDFKFPTYDIKKYPAFCGAGKGAGLWLVPEKMWGLIVSPACHNHDDMWDKAKRNYFAFIITNIIFLFNILMLIIVSDSNKFVNFLRFNRAFMYFTAVCTLGYPIFKRIKNDL